jgi:hypothetical protein
VLNLLRHLLCLGILLGLAGNGVAVAAPCILMAKSQPAAMAGMPDCEMGASCPDCASKSESGKDSKRGKDMRPGCMMMAGCTVGMAMGDPSAASTAMQAPPISDYWPVAAHLVGRDLAPEPEPPTLIG